MTDLRKLMDLCPPPDRDAAPVRAVGDGSARGAVGLPAEHQEMIAVYGVGCFDEFLWVYGEAVGNRHLCIEHRTETIRSVLLAHARPRLNAFLSEFGARTEELIQWGGTDNGDSLLWVPVGPPNGWPTLILEVRQRDMEVVRQSSVGIILGLLTGTLQSSIFPDDFPSSRPAFMPSFRATHD